ncbi:MAG: Gfo/Idh/MocA family oxidoreductase [Faecalibacterium sp.]
MQDKVIRFGVIGPGVIANKFADAVSRCDDAIIGAVASRNPERGAAFAAKYDIPTVHDTYEAILQDPNIDAIYVAVPHNWHAELAIAAMRNKKAVLCEKPCAINLAQAKQIIATAKEENVLFLEAMWTRFLPAMQKAHEWVKEGKIGDVHLLESSFAFSNNASPENRLYNRALAGGAMLDVGVYIIAFSLDFGQGALTKCSGMAQISDTGVDEMATLQMQFEDGTMALSSCGFVARTRPEACIQGNKGCIKLPDFWQAPDANLYNNDGEVVETYHDDQPNGFYHEVKHFAALWRAGAVESPRMPWSETIRMAEIYDGMLKEWGIAYE